jgi:hypothetical protein
VDARRKRRKKRTGSVRRGTLGAGSDASHAFWGSGTAVPHYPQFHALRRRLGGRWDLPSRRAANTCLYFAKCHDRSGQFSLVSCHCDLNNELGCESIPKNEVLQ